MAARAAIMYGSSAFRRAIRLGPSKKWRENVMAAGGHFSNLSLDPDFAAFQFSAVDSFGGLTFILGPKVFEKSNFHVFI